MKRRLIILAVTTVTLLLSGTVIQQTSSVDTVSGATIHSKPKVVTITNTGLKNMDWIQAEPELILADQAFPSDLDPAHEDNGRFTLSYGVGETLTFLDDEQRIQPWLAQSWENIDPLTWEIRLESGVKYHNGTDMTAPSVKESLERTVRINGKAAKLLPLSSVRADGLTLTIRTLEPCPELIHNLADPIFIIVDAGTEQKKDSSYFPVCTGPFIPVKFTGQTEIILQRFSDYHSGISALESAAIRYAADPDKLVKALEQNKADAAVGVPQESLPNFVEKGYHTQQTATAAAYLLMMNMESTVLSDENMRQAIASATNRQASSGAFAPLLPFSDDAESYPFNPGAAKLLLADAGYADPDGDGIADKNGTKLLLRLAVTAGETELLEWAQTLKAQLKQIGLEISIKTYSNVFFTSRARYGKFDMLLLAAPTAKNGDAQRFFEDYFASDGRLNDGHYRNGQVDSAIRRLESEFEPDQRILLTDQIQALALKDAAFIFLGYPQTKLVFEGNVSGLAVHPVYGYRLTANTTVKH